MIYPCRNEAKTQKYASFLSYASRIHQHNHTNSTSTIPTVSDIRNKLRDLPKTKTNSKQIIKEHIGRNMENKKKNIIYNYNYLKDKREVPSKRALHTLPSEPHRIDSHSKDRFASSRNIRMVSKDKLKSQSLSREPKIQEYPK